MLNIELIEYGLDEILKEMKEDLESVLGGQFSKKQKDYVICKTMGAVNALYKMINVTEVDVDTESKSNT